MHIRKTFLTNWHAVIQHKWAFIACSAMTKVAGNSNINTTVVATGIAQIAVGSNGKNGSKTEPRNYCQRLIIIWFSPCHTN